MTDMDDTYNIIAVRKRDVALAHQMFDTLMSKTETIMNQNAERNPDAYRNITPSDLERCSVDTIKQACNNTPFDPNEVLLVSGHRFPDIVAEKYYGIEVKSTVSNTWTSTGSSIVETTRVKDVEDIYMLFGKLGGTRPEFRCRPYQDVLYDIAVTHSPRYMIDMELRHGETIFSKMGVEYDDFRKSADNIERVRRYYRDEAKRKGKSEMPWWITSDNIENAQSFNIRLWSTLDAEEKAELKAKCMILFPEALSPKPSRTKYNDISLWLCSYNQVINPYIRDLYSAGGKITHVDGIRLESPVAQVFNAIVEYSGRIKELLTYPSKDLLQLIAEHNPALLKDDNLFGNWVTLCCQIAGSEIPLRKWIETKPRFTFSR